MVARELSELYGEPQSHASRDPVLEVRGTVAQAGQEGRAPASAIVSFTLHRGEVLAIAGLVGSGPHRNNGNDLRNAWHARDRSR